MSKLLDTFCEKSIECILLTLRSIGFSLRKDDPAALKELIITIQKKTSEASDELKAKYVKISKRKYFKFQMLVQINI